MENSYGIGVANRYDLFYNIDEDPVEIIKDTREKRRDKVSEKENQKVKKTKPSKEKKTTKPVEQTTKIVTEKVIKPNETNKSASTQKDNRVKFSDREERNNRRNKMDSVDKENTQFNRFDSESNKSNKPTDGETRRFDNETGNRPRFSDGECGRGRGRGSRGGRGGPRSDDGGNEGGFRGGRGGFRGGRGGRDFRGKREFDRKSGDPSSSVKHQDKRDGGGSFNWGSDKDQIIEEQWQQDKPGSDLDTSGGENVAEKVTENGVVAGSGEETEPAKEPEPKEMTFDEWKANQKREKPQFNIRRPGEGENNAQWKKTYILKKKDFSSAEESSENDAEDEETQETHHGRKKVVLPLDFQFSDAPTRGRGRGRGGRGDRGGERRGRGGMRGRGGRGAYQSRQEAPRMDDEKDFPSLG